VRKADASVIIAVGQKALALARDAAPTTPVVYCMVFERTVAASPYVSGVPLEIAARDQLSRIKDIAPHAKRVGIFYDSRTDAAFVAEATSAASAVGLTLATRPVSDVKEVRTAVAELAPNVDALWLLPDPKLVSKDVFNYLLVFTLERKIALFGFLDSFTQAGALASISPDYADIGRRAGELALAVLNKPADKRIPMPPAARSPGGLTINLKAAEQLGIEVSEGARSSARQISR
jgi:putative ABC transport system substrate-binding protein